MNSNIASIIGAILAAIAGWVLTYFFSNYERVPAYDKATKAIRNAVSGKWQGEFQQILNGQQLVIPLDLVLNVSKKGRIKGKISFSYNNEQYEIVVRGGFYLLHFLKLEYENFNQAIRQFGSFVLELSANSIELDGCFVGYGDKNKKVISGTIELHKVISLRRGRCLSSTDHMN